MAKHSLRLSLITTLFLLSAIFSCSLSKNTTYSNTNSKSGGIQLELIHIDSPKSPMYQPELTHLERTKRLFSISESRIRYLNKNTTHGRVSNGRVSNYDEQVYVTPISINAQGVVYYVEFGLGQLADGTHYNVSLSFDISGLISWTQCEGCVNCFPQRDRPYSMTSQTYKPVECNLCPGEKCSEQGHCMYEAKYADGSKVKGTYATDKLIFKSLFYADQIFPNFKFVCATEANVISVAVPGNVITGSLGMGDERSSSLLAQLTEVGMINKEIFSYCLKAYSDHMIMDGPMFLRFGDAVQMLPNMYIAHLHRGPIRGFYYVNLLDISVDDIKLQIPAYFFDINIHASGGTVFDTGTVMTYLVPGAYKILLSGISYFINKHNTFLKKHTAPMPFGFDCWEPAFESASVVIPSLTFHFSGAVKKRPALLVVEPARVMQNVQKEGVPSPGLYCLRVGQRTDLNVIGSFYQAKYQMIFNVRGNELKFIQNDCNN